MRIGTICTTMLSLLLVTVAGATDDQGRPPGEKPTVASPPQKISGPNPAYTEEARRAGVEGVVILTSTIQEDGTVSDVDVLEGLGHGLDDAAKRAVEQWRFEPAKDDAGNPVEVCYTLRVSFELPYDDDTAANDASDEHETATTETTERISLSLRDADLREVLRTFARIGDFNLVLDPEIEGTVTVELDDVPWDRALEQILKVNDLWYEIDGNVLAIDPR